MSLKEDIPNVCPYTSEQVTLSQKTKHLLHLALHHLQDRYISIKPIHTIVSYVFKGLDVLHGKEVVLKCFEQSMRNPLDMYHYCRQTETEGYLLSHFYNHPAPYIAYPIDRFCIDKSVQLAEWKDIKDVHEHLPNNFVVYVFIYYPYTLETIDLRSITPVDKKRWCRQIATALHYLHSIGFYYGDLKSSNICIEIDTESGISSTRLIDFGMACGLENMHYIKNTIFFFTPIQAVNHSPLYSTKFFPTEIQQSIVGLLYRKGLSNQRLTKTSEGYVYQPEHGIRVDLFGFALMILYIFGNGFMFYSRKVISDFASKECRNMLIGCIEFILYTNSFVEKVFTSLRSTDATPLPEEWERDIQMMLTQVLSSSPAETTLTFDHFKPFLLLDHDE